MPLGDDWLNRLGDRLFVLRERLAAGKGRGRGGDGPTWGRRLRLALTPQMATASVPAAAGRLAGSLRQRPWVIAAAAIGVLAGAVGPQWLRAGHVEPPVTPRAWFYDLSSGELFIADEQPAPIPAPSHTTQADGSPSGVRAVVYACGDCNDAAQRFIAHLEQYTPAGRDVVLGRREAQGRGGTGDAVRGDPGNPGDPAVAGRRVAAPGADQWHPIASADGQDIVRQGRGRCGKGRFPSVCSP